MMQLSKLFLSLLCGISLQLHAQHALLIKITPPESDKASYIFAATNNSHVVEYDFLPIFNTALDQVNAVAFEWLPENYELENMLSVMKNTGDETLRKYYKRDDNIRFELFIINKLQQDVEKYLDLQPLYIMQVMRNFEYGAGLQYQQQVLQQAAIDRIKPIISLWNLQEIREQMEQIDFDTQAAILSDFVNREAEFNTYESVKWQTYKQQNLADYFAAMKAIESTDYMNLVIDRQAERLSQKIAALSAQQSTLYFIDAALLGGDKGVLQTLRTLNYQIEDIAVALSENQHDSSDVNIDSLGGDMFPDIIFYADTTRSTQERTIVVRRDEIAKQFGAKYKAMEDPFADMLDYSAQDTTFLNSWYTLQSTEADLKFRAPANSPWEETITETLNGQVKSSTVAMNHARSDLYYSAGYTIYPPNFDPGDKAMFFDDIIYRAVRKLKGDLLAQRLISTPDYIGREITVMISDSFFVRSKFVLKGNILYQFLTGGPKNNVYSAYSLAFFNSISIEGNKAGKWVAVTTNFFTCELPTQPLVQKQTYNTQYGPLEVQTYNSQDYGDDIAYFISVNAYPPGYNFKNTNDFYEDLIANAERQYVGRAVKTETVKKNGMKGRYVELQLVNQKIYRMYIFFRHNIVYQYLAGGTLSAMQSLNPQYFFDHFVFAVDEK